MTAYYFIAECIVYCLLLLQLETLSFTPIMNPTCCTSNNLKNKMKNNDIIVVKSREHIANMKYRSQSSFVNYSSNNSNPDEESRISLSSYATLFILVLTFTSNQWCRQLIYYLSNFSNDASESFKYMNIDLGFSKEYYASLASFGFTIVFALSSIFTGKVADKYNRNNIIAASSLGWSVSTILQGFVKQSMELMPLRVLTGFTQAFFNPAAYTILADIFPSNMLASVNGLLSSSIYLGGGLASLSILLDSQYGWRNTMIIVGGISSFMSILAYLIVLEPRVAITKENGVESRIAIPDATSIIDSIREVLSIAEVRILYLSSLLRFGAGFTIGIWKAPFIFEKFPGNEDLFSSTNAFIISVFGLTSSLLGGYIADRLNSPSDRSVIPRSRLWVPAIGSLLAVPCWTLFIQSKDPFVSAVALTLEYLFAEAWIGPTLANLYSAVPKNRRGVAQGIFSILIALGNFVPFIVGKLTGGSLGNYAIGDTILYMVNIAYILSGLGFLYSAIQQDNFYQKKERVT